jgi:SAM-dependent methyltransferase
MKQEEVREFFDAWSLYDQVLDRNYMFHEEIYRDVAQRIASRFTPGNFLLMDLGCGSARHLSAALESCPPARYVGYDLSLVALGQARRRLAGRGFSVDLRQANLADGLQSRGGPLDLIVSSFVLHHFPEAEKQSLLQQACRRLRPGGALILVDTARQDGEDRTTYLERYCGWIESEWQEISREGRDSIHDHIRTCDFPEASENLHALSAGAGFAACHDVNRFRWHQTWLMEKAD